MTILLPALRVAGRRIATPRRVPFYPIRNSLPGPTASFHASAYRSNDNSPPKSPFQTFVDVLQEEIKKNRQLQENVLQLKGDVDKMQDSEAMKRARDVYERARVE